MIEARTTWPEGGRAMRFAALDGWRGVCAVMIVFLHAPIAGTIGEAAFVRNSFLFVDFFFVLSGFVIAHAFAARITNWREAGAFSLSRVKRVYPLHLVMLALFLVFELLMLALRGPGAAFTGGNGVGAFFANLTMTHSLGVVDRLGWNYPSWSISAELVAYGLFALLLVLVPRLLVPVLLAVVVVAPVVLYVAVGHIDVTVVWGWLRCLFGFSLGVLLRLLVWPRMETRGPAQGGAAWTLAEIATVLAVILFVVAAGTTPVSLAAPFVFAYALLVFAHEGGAVSRLLKSAPFAFLGLVSYSIYMTHAFVISRGINAASAAEAVLGVPLMVERADGSSVVAGGDAEAVAAMAAILAATIVFSALTHRFVEKPGQRLRLSFGRRAPASAGTI